MVYKEKDVQQDFCVLLHFLRDIYLPAFILTKPWSKTSNKLANSVIPSSPTKNTNWSVSDTTRRALLLSVWNWKGLQSHYTCTSAGANSTVQGYTRLVTWLQLTPKVRYVPQIQQREY